MKIERRENSVVVINYDNNMGAKYDFSLSKSNPSIKRTFNNVSNQKEDEAELKLAQNALKILPERIAIKKSGVNKVQIEEVVAEDTSLKTTFDFGAKKVSQTSLDNNEGETPGTEYSFGDFNENVSNKAKLEIAKQAKILIKSEFKF